MAIEFDDLFSTMMDNAADAFGDGWQSIKNYAPGEFKKLALQLVDITENVAKYQLNPDDGFSPETGKALLVMQRNAAEAVLVAMSTLTLLAVQKALNAIFDVLKTAFQGVLSSVL